MLLSPQDIVAKMLERDAFSRWMQVQVRTLGEGHCTLSCQIHSEMLNGFDILHGGIYYSLADSALAFAANSRGYKAVSVETSISHFKALRVGAELTAVASELNRGRSIGTYEVHLFQNQNELVAHFKGTVKVSKEAW